MVYLQDIGAGKGKYYAVNFPLRDGIDDDAYENIFKPVSFYPGPEVIKLLSRSAQLRLKFILLINVKTPTVVGVLTFISRINYRLWHSKP